MLSMAQSTNKCFSHVIFPRFKRALTECHSCKYPLLCDYSTLASFVCLLAALPKNLGIVFGHKRSILVINLLEAGQVLHDSNVSRLEGNQCPRAFRGDSKDVGISVSVATNHAVKQYRGIASGDTIRVNGPFIMDIYVFFVCLRAIFQFPQSINIQNTAFNKFLKRREMP